MDTSRSRSRAWWGVGAASALAFAGAGLVWSPAVGRAAYVEPASLRNLRDHLASAQTMLVLFTDRSLGHNLGLSSFLWVAADRASGRAVVYLHDVGFRGTGYYVLDDGALTRYRLHGRYGQPEVPVALEFGAPAAQVAAEALADFSNSTFSNDGGFSVVSLPFPWANGVDLRFHPSRIDADPEVDLPGSLTITVGGKRTSFLIQDALWDFELPPSFFEDSSEAARATSDAVVQWVKEGRLRYGRDLTPSL